MNEYESVIGLEVHVQIKTESKLFCSCPTTFGSAPNANICPVCCGYPGVLPVLNRRAAESLVKTGLALGCRINSESIFARKQYFYPDLPKNYQISQYELPLAERGSLGLGDGQKIGVTRIHLEEDAGKLLHEIGSTRLDGSLVDLNRTGVPLMEIVSEPDLRSPDQAQEYLGRLKTVVQYLGVSDCDMEKGSMRCDANVSIRPKGSDKFGNRVEIKNMNSFRGVRDAIEYEIDRQIRATEAGERIAQETRLWDADLKASKPMRSKEEAHDYRYFPEPDLLPLRLSEQWIADVKNALPELPAQKRSRFMNEYKLGDYDTNVLTSTLALANYYESAAAGLQNREPEPFKMLSNFITTELLGRLNKENLGIEASPIQPKQMANLVDLTQKGTISGKIAKTVVEDMWKSGKDPEELVKEKGLVQISNAGQIEQWVDEAIRQSPKPVDEYRKGKLQVLGSLVGSVMKISKGQANPQLVNEILKKKLEGNG